VVLKWTPKAHEDLARLHEFLLRRNLRAARRVLPALVSATERLIELPRMGERLEEFEPREVRRFFVGKYEMRYEVLEKTILVLRVWHAREHR
jgi:plasmid stabilization system protein ParE